MRHALLALTLLLAGCATVPPYERGTLATSRMSLDGDLDEAYLVASRRRVREEGVIAGGAGAAAASGAAGGGGCGCN